MGGDRCFELSVLVIANGVPVFDGMIQVVFNQSDIAIGRKGAIGPDSEKNAK
jgi:hypothetical protein